MGTIVSIVPIAIGLVEATTIPVNIALSAVIGGAMFGDNLSVISDTTIASIKTQNCHQSDKLKQNFLLVLPAALLATAFYCYIGSQFDSPHGALPQSPDHLIKLIPYGIVIVGAILGGNVLVLLTLGNFSCGLIGWSTGEIPLTTIFAAIHQGMVAMEDLSILSMVAAGTIGLIESVLGIQKLLTKATSLTRSKKRSEYGIGLLAITANLFVANNTIAILMVGPLARSIAQKSGIPGKRSASLIDIGTSACQGVLPYGAQVLAACSVAKLSPLALLPYNIYPYLTVLFTVLGIQLNFPRTSHFSEERIQHRLRGVSIKLSQFIDVFCTPFRKAP